MKINGDFIASVQKHTPCTEATLDEDATLAATQKKDALFSYKGYKAYRPFNTWWAEQQMIIHTEFRDGNVPAGYEQLRVFIDSLAMLPPGVTKVCLRSDTLRVSARPSQILRDGNELINWYHKRCGKSEEAHSVMKEDFAGGKLPAALFGANTAWWWIMVLAHNLNTAMKNLVLKKSWIPKRMKAIRFSLITLPGRIIERSRELIIRIAKGHPSLAVLLKCTTENCGACTIRVGISGQKETIKEASGV